MRMRVSDSEEVGEGREGVEDAPYSLDGDNLAGGDVYSSERVYGDVNV